MWIRKPQFMILVFVKSLNIFFVCLSLIKIRSVPIYFNFKERGWAWPPGTRGTKEEEPTPAP